MIAEHAAGFLFFVLVFGTGIAIAVGIAWFDHRTRTRALEVLRVYAERGEEPPASVIQALTRVSGFPKGPPPDDNKDRLGRPRTRGGFLAHAAASAVFAVGFSAFAWWRYAALGDASPSVMIAIFLALFNAASMAAQLVGAYYTPHR
jgi:hypothetical protein